MSESKKIDVLAALVDVLSAMTAHKRLQGQSKEAAEGMIALIIKQMEAEVQPVSQDPAAAWDQLRAQLWGARSGCGEAWVKMSKDIKGVDRDLMSHAVQVSLVENRLRVNFAREFYLNHRNACHSTIGYWVAAARHLGHTSRPGKRDDGSGYVEFSLEPSSD